MLPPRHPDNLISSERLVTAGAMPTEARIVDFGMRDELQSFHLAADAPGGARPV